jgi:hypothetical protein
MARSPLFCARRSASAQCAIRCYGKFGGFLLSKCNSSIQRRDGVSGLDRQHGVFLLD